jgi:hypothetical protein
MNESLHASLTAKPEKQIQPRDAETQTTTSYFIVRYGRIVTPVVAAVAVTSIWWRPIGRFLDTHNGAISALAAIAVAGFTLALWRSTDRLWEASEQQRADAETAKQEESRAYVFVFDVTIGVGEHFDPMKYLASYHLIVKNSGRTPAYNVTIVNAVALWTPEVDGKPFPSQSYPSDGSRSPLGPDSTVTIMTDSVPWNEEQRSLLNAGQVPYLHGIIRYDDAFGNKWWTQFRHERVKGSHAFTACANGNDAKRTSA